jgi:hypothetical protein
MLCVYVGTANIKGCFVHYRSIDRYNLWNFRMWGGHGTELSAAKAVWFICCCFPGKGNGISFRQREATIQHLNLGVRSWRQFIMMVQFFLETSKPSPVRVLYSLNCLAILCYFATSCIDQLRLRIIRLHRICKACTSHLSWRSFLPCRIQRLTRIGNIVHRSSNFLREPRRMSTMIPSAVDSLINTGSLCV